LTGFILIEPSNETVCMATHLNRQHEVEALFHKLLYRYSTFASAKVSTPGEGVKICGKELKSAQ